MELFTEYLSCEPAFSLAFPVADWKTNIHKNPGIFGLSITNKLTLSFSVAFGHSIKVNLIYLV